MGIAVISNNRTHNNVMIIKKKKTRISSNNFLNIFKDNEVLLKLEQRGKVYKREKKQNKTIGLFHMLTVIFFFFFFFFLGGGGEEREEWSN